MTMMIIVVDVVVVVPPLLLLMMMMMMMIMMLHPELQNRVRQMGVHFGRPFHDDLLYHFGRTIRRGR